MKYCIRTKKDEFTDAEETAIQQIVSRVVGSSGKNMTVELFTQNQELQLIKYCKTKDFFCEEEILHYPKSS